jgi:hypothetical protein
MGPSNDRQIEQCSVQTNLVGVGAEVNIAPQLLLARRSDDR